jgi:anti-sigma-K factor RskA
MSTLYLFPPEQEQPEDHDLLAAEYALGALDAGDAASARLRAETDPALRHAIAVWQARLALLAEILPREAPPRALWQRLAADIGLPDPPAPQPAAEPAPTPPPIETAPPEPLPVVNLFASLSEPAPEPAPEPALAPALEQQPNPAPARRPAIIPAPKPASGQPWHQRLILWRAATAVLLALCLLLAIRLLLPTATAVRQVAAIGPTGAPAPLFLAETSAAGVLTLTPLATIAVPNGRDLELWTVPADHSTAPVALGVLPAAGGRFALRAVPPEGTQLLVSMEPRGGEPGGVLTGQVLYAGTLANH